MIESMLSLLLGWKAGLMKLAMRGWKSDWTTCLSPGRKTDSTEVQVFGLMTSSTRGSLTKRTAGSGGALRVDLMIYSTTGLTIGLIVELTMRAGLRSYSTFH